MLDLNDVECCWIKDGVINIRTPSCGCCSEYISSNDDWYSVEERPTKKLVEDYIARERANLTELENQLKELE